MAEYFQQLFGALMAPAIAIAVLGAVGKWYLDRVLDRQTSKLEASLEQEGERLKVSLANKVAITQAKLQSLQQVSKAVYTARRACRDLNEIVFPQSEGAEARLLKLGQGDGKALVNLANERNIALGEATLALEEQLYGAKEYLALGVISNLERLLGNLFSLRSKVGEFFVPTQKPSTFVTELGTKFAETDNNGMEIENLLVIARKDLLNAKVG